jgi:hypothetical protein
MQPTQTALIVPIPAAENAVGPFRATLDRSASWGVPAHVTVLYPFLPPDKINSEVLAARRHHQRDTTLRHHTRARRLVRRHHGLAGPAAGSSLP